MKNIYILLVVVLISCKNSKNSESNEHIHIDYQRINLSGHIIGSAEGMHLVD